MTLDPVHFDGITRLARRLGGDVDERDHRDLAETVWREFLDPLYAADGDHAVLEPLDEQRRRRADVEAVALRDEAFPTTHGLDAGTVNPTTFTNGLVLDVAHAAMGACPSALDLHRDRTIVLAAHTNDRTRDLQDDWQRDDDGHCRQRVVQAPRVDRYAEGVVHALALYLAESEHALAHAGEVDDLLYLDGPLYPKGLLNWRDRDRELSRLLEEDELVRGVLGNYLALVERFVERDVPLVGFVKNPGSKAVTRALRARAEAPWTDDAALFRQVLERRTDDGERVTDELTVTNWFRSRGGADAVVSTAGDGFGLDRDLPPESYEVTMQVLYDPRTDVVYKLEAPYAVTRDAEVREAITRQTLSAVAAERGPPPAIAKADALAGIGREETASLRERLAAAFDARQDRTYDDVRWPMEEA